jgi:hypothetical protein
LKSTPLWIRNISHARAQCTLLSIILTFIDLGLGRYPLHGQSRDFRIVFLRMLKIQYERDSVLCLFAWLALWRYRFLPRARTVERCMAAPLGAQRTTRACLEGERRPSVCTPRRERLRCRSDARLCVRHRRQRYWEMRPYQSWRRTRRWRTPLPLVLLH